MEPSNTVRRSTSELVANTGLVNASCATVAELALKTTVGGAISNDAFPLALVISVDVPLVRFTPKFAVVRPFVPPGKSIRGVNDPLPSNFSWK